MDPDIAAERFTRLAWEIEEADGGGERGAEGAGGGWSWVLSGLKTLLETGKALQG
jgi:hypothetical protein